MTLTKRAGNVATSQSCARHAWAPTLTSECRGCASPSQLSSSATIKQSICRSVRGCCVIVGTACELQADPRAQLVPAWPVAIERPSTASLAIACVDGVRSGVSHKQAALHQVPVAARQRRALQVHHHLPGGGQGKERVSGLPARLEAQPARASARSDVQRRGGGHPGERRGAGVSAGAEGEPRRAGGTVQAR